MEKFGLIPAAGMAKRLGSLPCSKELLPVGYKSENGERRLKTVSEYLLDKFRQAGLNKVYTVIREGKWDIPNYYGNGVRFGVHMAYLIMNHPYGVPYTLDQTFPFIKNAKIFFGFPDILFGPENAFSTAEAVLDQRNADIMLGLYPVKDEKQIKKSDMVQCDQEGRIKKILVKPKKSDLLYSWIFAIWQPAFTLFMHRHLMRDLAKRKRSLGQTQIEIHLGHVVQSAIENGLSVYGHTFTDYHFIDVGNLGNISQALREYLLRMK